ncbi:nicotinamide riboside transporter PnuC [Arenicella xantha]|uniref:Nicotinamide riboside transporter PnuC n=1 Tax=Arenicella xantha TaxID=644221 RepID=A0A395JPW7_9GAMM|nr:nicotinamide riboside transporter PnuC [Arenicella xantha]RBP53691.1 nicotinamide mononucleotide transporter [Arenicella xantha]
MSESLLAAWQATSTLELVSVLFGLAYVILAAKENSWCWPAALGGTATAIWLFWDVSLLMESALNVYYLGMAIFGWWQWQYGSSTHSPLAISSWHIKQHALAIGSVVVLTLISGTWLARHTEAALPYVDSFTTWAAVITTWMVTRKILQNWLYWVVIDAVSVWLFWQKELYLYALLFAFYTVIALYGYRHWRIEFLHAKPTP